jgi:probable HAF family extracellular repeat protein
MHSSHRKQLIALNLFAAVTLVVALTSPRQLAAQDNKHHHYKLIDLGTLGGPHSYGSVNGDGFRLLNNSGVVAAFADTALPDPNAPNHCFDPDCFLAHAFRWKDGVLTDLGALPGNNNSAAGSINARGWITGQAQNGLFDPILNGPGVHAVLWKDGHITDLGSLGGNASLGIYVNDAGQAIGLSDNTTPDPFSLFGIGVQIRTFLWEDGVMRDIGTLGGPDAVPGTSCSGQPRDVVVGFSYTSSTPNASTGVPTLDAFLWRNGKMIDLGNLGGTISGPIGPCANNRDQVIGVSDLAGDLVSHAFFFDDGVMTDLGTLGGNNSEAIWLNDAGDVVGSADLPGSQIHDAVLWRHGDIHDLGTVPGDPCSRGRGLNSRGEVVGGSSDCRNFLHAFVWEEGGPMLDLNMLIAPGSGFQLTNAFNINDRGEILAKAAPLGFTPNDDADLGHLVLLVPCERDQEEGCEGSAEATSRAAPRSSALVNGTTPQGRLTPRENLAAWRTQIMRRYHIPGLGTPKD